MNLLLHDKCQADAPNFRFQVLPSAAGDMPAVVDLVCSPLRWIATGLLEAEKRLRRIKGYQEILLLKERLKPSRIPQKEVRAVEVA